MEDNLCMEQFTFDTLPLSERQLNDILLITKMLRIDPERGLILKMPNYDDPEEIRIRWIDGGYFMGLSFPMDEIGWSHPLVLAAEGLEYEDVEMLVTEICVNQTDTMEIELIMTDYRNVTSEVYGKE